MTAAVILNHGDNVNALNIARAFEAYTVIDHTVIADNTGGGGLDALELSKSELLKLPNGGYAAGNNAAVRYIEEKYGLPDYIVISNPDVEVDEAAVAACVDFLRLSPGYALAAPRMYDAQGRPHHLSAWRERTFLCDFAYSSGLLSRLVGMCRECYPESAYKQRVMDVDCAAGSFFIVSGPVFKKAGLFDEHTFLYYEEDILGYKLKQMGYKSAVLNDYRFTHYESVSVNRSMNYLKKYLAMQRSRLYFHRRYKKTAALKMLALYAATGLGIAEKALKTAYHMLAAGKKPKLQK